MITCNMVCHSHSDHLTQICTGFVMLQRAGEIELSQECRRQEYFDETKPQHLRDASYNHMRVTVNCNTRLYYDCHDSYELDELAATEVDYYFKRSYAQSKVPDSLKPKVFPLGFNYPVYSAEFDAFEQQRFSTFQPELAASNTRVFKPAVEEMHAVPDKVHDPSVLFITHAWDPYDHPERSNKKIAERISINERRAHCIELLRQEFGDRFLGGLVHTDYAARNYESALLQNNEVSEKKNYIKLLSQFPVCVAARGLHGSIGWTMGEYVAFSRAIVSERLNYQVPGDFKPRDNYLEFDDPEQCVTAVHKLVSDAALRWGMMKNNREYYLTYLKPDAMIKRTLHIALSKESSPGW